MKKLEVGMYVRTNEGIRKIIGEYNEFYELNKMLHFRYPEGHHLYKEDIDKIVVGEPSYNIIDLIEEGDYVNGSIVDDFYTTYNEETDSIIRKGVITNDCYLENSLNSWLEEKDIKSVVTHEQFESMKYEI